MSRPVTRRDFLASGLVIVGGIVAGPAVWRRALAAPSVGDGPYGPLQAPDANGIMLPRDFTSRVVARSGRRVAGTSYVWHEAPDGGATFPLRSGGWVYVSNSELGDRRGGVGAIRFDERARIVDAYRIASDTSRNCAGGPTPWGTWLSCEEHDGGRVWECDPSGKRRAKPLPALGVFQHEAAAVDPVKRHVYLTEDQPDGRFYRFVPSRYPALDEGRLEVALVSPDGATRWRAVPDPSGRTQATRRQVAGATRFVGGEGTWYDAGVVYFTTKGDNRVWAYDTRSDRMSLFYDASAIRNAPLTGVDNVTASAASGDVFVAEDGGDLEIVMITPDAEVARLLRLTGGAHDGSEIAGPAFDPSGTRLYFSSQRGFDRGITYEIRGPFRVTRADRTPEPTAPTTPRATPSPATAVGGSPPPITASPTRTQAPLPLASDDDGVPGAAVGAAAAASAGAIAGAAALRRRRRRRATETPDD